MHSQNGSYELTSVTGSRGAHLSPRRPRGRRFLIGVIAAAVSLGLVAITAPAAQAEISGTAELGGFGLDINYSTPDNPDAWQQVFPFQLFLTNGNPATAYCVQEFIGTEDGSTYTEGGWSDIPNIANAAWITQHSAPEVSLGDLTTAVEAHSGTTIAPAYDIFEAQGITQLAIWSYTDGFQFSSVISARRHNAFTGTDIPPEIDLDRLKLLFDYLTDPSVNVGVAQPVSSLALDASGATWNGTSYGPITVQTSVSNAALTVTGAAGAEVVDADGNPVTSANNGDFLYLRVPSIATAGSATVSATVPEATLQVGRLMLHPEFQSMIVSDASTDRSVDQVTTSWSGNATPTPTPTPSATTAAAGSQLADTGSDQQGGIAMAGALLALGLIAAIGTGMVGRRRATR